jgi:predicted permease
MRRDAATAPQRTRTRSVLVFGQTMITVVLLIVAGLFLRAITSLELLDTGWVADDVHVVTMDLELNGTDQDRGQVFYRELLDRVSGVTGVESGALAAKLPLAGSSSMGDVNAEGVAAPAGRLGHHASFNRVSPGYLTTLQIPLLQGRDVATTDGPDDPVVAVINRAMAVRLFGDAASAVGRQFFVGRVGEGTPFQVVGVAGDAKYNRLTEDVQNFFYVPYPQLYNSQMSLHVRMTPSAAATARTEIARIIRELDPVLPVPPMQPLEESLEVFFLPQRMAAWISGLMGALGLILGAVGVYGVTSFNAAQRRREMGIRMALGAGPADIIRLIVGQGLVSPVVGVATGLAIAFGVTRFLSSLLAGISPLDPVAFATVILLLGLVALAAVATPAIRTARSDPVVSLRTD